MRHVFLDASVLLAFSRSTTGGSAFILECCEQRKIKGYISKKVVFESEKNAAEDMGEEAIKALAYVFSQGFLTIVPDCTKSLSEKYCNFYKDSRKEHFLKWLQCNLPNNCFLHEVITVPFSFLW